MGCSDQQPCAGNSDKLILIQTTISGGTCDGNAVNNKREYNSFSKHYIIGALQTRAGAIPQISCRLNLKDHLGAFMVRWGIRRDRYRVDPGLYAVGTPNERSDVLVTANYKLTFDTVRKNLEGMNVWLLVLDTKGVNVWCAAGKGTFGTKELINRIQLTSLDKIVQHKRIILPQLGAVGVAAHQVKDSSGFTILYGPIRASDIPAFLHAGYKTTKDMRRVLFGWYDRLKLVPNELIYNLRYLGLMLILFFILSGINGDGISLKQASTQMVALSKIILAGYISGIVFTPLMLPYLIFRSFSFKGYFVGVLVSSIMILSGIFDNTTFVIPIIFFLLSGFSSFLAMNFTGSSTYTSLAGVKKEMRIAVPVQIASGVIAAVLVILSGFFSGR